MASERPSFGLFEDLERFNSEQENLRWEKNFAEYVEKVGENPQIVRTAHQYLHDAITSRPDFFQTGPNALFGAEKATSRFIEVLHGGAQGLEIRKRIILFMGPPGSGKSTLVNAAKRGLEEYSKTLEGAKYAIADCPMHEEPLHLIPQDVRPKWEALLGVSIEGDLCPQCREKYGSPSKIAALNDPKIPSLQEVPVKRIILSEKERVGIGTFKPSDPKSQDITELVGSVDFSKLGEFGVASDPRAYRFDGELNVANGGVMEFVELLKSDEKFLYSLLDLAQDRVIKAPRFSNIYADEVILSHTNETEYKNYVGNDRNEALRDRMIVIPVPYNLRVSDERKIYDKLINQSEIIKGSKVHINPHAIDVASTFAVLSRLEPSKKPNVSKMQKLKIYDGQTVENLSSKDLKELQEEAPREGMFGISPRYVIDALSLALIQNDRECLTALDTIRAVRDNLDYHPHTRDMKPEQKKTMHDNLAFLRQEYDEIAKKEVQSAFVYSYEENARSLSDNYLENVEAFCEGRKIVDPVTDEEVAPDENLMRSIEEQINITDNGKKEFRQEILVRIGALARKGEKFDYTAHPRLREAIEKKLFADMKDVVKLTTNAKLPNKDQQRRIGEVQQTLIDEKGYCPHCADELIQYVG